MNHSRKELHELLDEVLPHDGSACGPDRAAVLHMVSEQRARRRRHRTMGAALAAAAAACLINFAPGWLPRGGSLARHTAAPPASMSSIPAAQPAMPQALPGPSRVVIQEVDDQQLLALLQDTPAALMVWPNGRRTLLVVGH
jgi:hypothetical protein